MADYGVNIKVKVQGQNNAKQLGEQVREIVSGLEAADRAFTRFSNNLKSFDQRRAQRKINEELDKTAQKYRELDRLQRQLLANDNSAIKAAEKRAKLEEFISKNISAGRMRRRARFLRGDPEQYPSGANQPFAPDPMVAIRKLRDAEATANRQIFDIKQELIRNLNNTEIDLLQEKIKREMDAQQEIFSNAMRLNQKAADDFDRRLAQATRDRSEATRLTGQTSPIGGAVGIPGSPAALAAAERAKRLQRAGGSALIGGAFPLLFGQGLGASFGGAAGGFGGGMLGGEFGFGLSLVGTQIGSLIDQLATKAGELGQALNPATADVDALVEALGLVGSPTKESIDALRELAGEQAALEAATHQLSLVVGDDGVEALANLGDASTRFGNALTRVTTQVLAEVARLTGGVAQKIAEALEFEADLTAAKASKDPKMAVLQGQLANVNVFEDVISGRQRAGIEAQMVDLQRKIRAEEEASLEAAVEKARIGSVEHTIAKNNLTIAKLNGDLTNERVFRLEKANIFQEALRKSQEEGADKKLIELERDAQLLELTNRRNDALEAANAKIDRLSKKEQRAIDRKIKSADKEIERAAKAFERADNQLDKIINKNKDKVAFEREYAELIKNGSTPAAAEQAIELKKQQLELDRNFNKLKEQLDLQVKVAKAAILEAKARGASGDELDKLNKDLADLLEQIGKLPGKKENAEGAILEALAPKSDRETLNEYLKELQGELNKLMNPANQLIGFAKTLGGAFSESFKGIVSGSMSAREALANLFQRTADHFLDMAAQIIAAQIKMQAVNLFMSFFSPTSGGTTSPTAKAGTSIPSLAPSLGGGGPLNDPKGLFTSPTLISQRAIGGAVGAGRPYMVGERGPELFVPGAQGNIVPNNAMGSTSVVVNVDASGTEVQGNQGGAEQLGRLIGQAVQAELIKQKRPGGLLTR